MITQKQLYSMAITGGISAVGYADVLLNKALRTHGPEKEVGYPDTGYELPCFYGWTETPVKKLGDLPPLLGEAREKIQHEPTYENALLAGEATMWAAEIVEAIRYIDNDTPYAHEAPPGTQEYCGFVGDPILRTLGIAFVDDTIPGAIVFVGKAKDPKALAKMIRDCQNKGMLLMATFDIIRQLEDEGISMGTDIMLFPLGEFTQAIHGLSFAIRAALTFGGVQRGDREGLLKYLKMRPKVVVIQLGPIDQIKAAAEFAVLSNGSPTVTDQDVEEIPGKYVVQKDYDQIIQTAIEIRDMEIKLEPIDIPVAYGPAFEGETVRRPDTYVEVGGPSKTKVFELVKMREANDIEDGKITFIGKDADELEEGSTSNLGILIEVYGKKMQEDYESVLERRIHQFINFAEGAWHTGQRNLLWVRLSKKGVESGLQFKHFGDILYAKLHDEFGALLNRIQVTIMTDLNEIEKHFPEAKEAYDARDKRVAGLTDEKVETFYTCTLCQSFAPNHVCIVSPERLGLCGAINWMDAKASNQITPTGPNQPVIKGDTLDDVKGRWTGVDDAVREHTHGKLDSFNLYTMMEEPMTSCGCFECIVGLEPMSNGVVVVNREHSGMTPLGMKFSTLAGTVGGGLQTPGFIGVGRYYLVSKKFISADGGFHRIVWMPKQLKE
ncbi:MAG: CO dehydrogenase/CO-methylating acetyl-CoA synthase complex subunit beta, partial [Thermoplasmata archaeon]|nr:CO dehydrogenase/CO-methylating acetyl-CoA synthase complex subunit beta [Thermoplasmata archaeon]